MADPTDKPASSPPASHAAQPHDAYAAIKDGNYQRYIVGFALAASGLQALATAVGWEVFERTKDPLHLGFTGLARALPVVLLALPAGHIADVFERKKIIFLSQVGFALCAAMLAALSWFHAPIWLIYVVLVLTGCCRAFNGPARGSFLPIIVPKHVFPNAVAWTSTTFQFAAIAGPLAAGFLLGWRKEAWPVYAFCLFCNLAFAIAVIGIHPLAKPISSGKYTASAMFAGMSHVWRERTVLGAISLDLFAVLLGGATVLMPLFAKEILGGDAHVLGWLRAAPYIGSFVMGVYLAHRPPFKRSGRALLWSVVGFGVGTIIFGLSKNLWLSLAALFVLGAVDNVSVVIRHVLVQVRTPDRLRGRVGAVNSVFIECSNELGAFESGAVAKLFGPVVSVVTGGIGTILVAAGIGAANPQLRNLGELREDPSHNDNKLLCSVCGYDLDDLMGQTCPECGAAHGLPTPVKRPPV